MKLRTIHFLDETACMAEIRRLQAGYRNGGTWSLPQTCWHLNVVVARSLREPANPEPTPEQQTQLAFIDQVITSGWPEGATSPSEIVPPDNVGSEAVDSYIASLQQLKEYRPTHVDAFLFGPIATDKFRQFVLIHAADHLSFMEAK